MMRSWHLSRHPQRRNHDDQGKEFTSKVQMGDTIVKGQVLIEFDKDALIKKGYEIFKVRTGVPFFTKMISQYF